MSIIYLDQELGHNIVIIKHYLNNLVAKALESHQPFYYCGYVEVLPEDPLYNCDENSIEENFDLPSALGGITYAGNLENLGGYFNQHNSCEKPFFIGFDTAHFGIVNSSLEEVKLSCKKLAHEISSC